MLQLPSPCPPSFKNRSRASGFWASRLSTYARWSPGSSRNPSQSFSHSPHGTVVVAQHPNALPGILSSLSVTLAFNLSCTEIEPHRQMISAHLQMISADGAEANFLLGRAILQEAPQTFPLDIVVPVQIRPSSATDATAMGRGCPRHCSLAESCRPRSTRRTQSWIQSHLGLRRVK